VCIPSPELRLTRAKFLIPSTLPCAEFLPYSAPSPELRITKAEFLTYSAPSTVLSSSLTQHPALS
jgi:hypothetical protein